MVHREDILRKKDRKKHVICVIIGICISLVLTGMITKKRLEAVDRKMAEVQERISQEVFRFHVLANSDSDEDQKIKLEVRDEVLSYMKDEMGEEASAEETKKWAASHLEELKETARKVLMKEGFDYGVSAEVTTCYFPEIGRAHV